MREYVKSHKFNPEAMTLVRQCVQIVTNFQSRGFRMTLRQLYYQLVKDNIIPNQEKQYKRLSALLSDARLMGFIDWSAIEDRIRVPRMPSEFENLDELVDAALATYRLPRWKDQPHYVELWVEKDALAGILQPLAREYHVPMMVNRGYSSQTAMYDAGKRFLTGVYGDVKLPYMTLAEFMKGTEVGDKNAGSSFLKETFMLNRDKLPKPKKDAILFYLGDHDPSGEDMVRDIQERLEMYGVPLDVRKLALTMDQVEEYDPPPNPAKMSDPRAAEYVDKHGDTSWEVDALGPDVLDQLIRDAFDGVVDKEKMDAIKEEEEADKKLLREAVKSVRNRKEKK
jgi:hypothetical protein